MKNQIKESLKNIAITIVAVPVAIFIGGELVNGNSAIITVVTTSILTGGFAILTELKNIAKAIINK